jgi:hypothetical protein
MIYNSNLANPTWPNPMLDVTSFFNATLTAGNQYLGINFRTTGYLPPVNTIDNWFSNPRLIISYEPIPEPTLPTMLGGALIVLLVRRRRAAWSDPFSPARRAAL